MSKYNVKMINQFDLGNDAKETKFKYTKKGKKKMITRNEVIQINNEIQNAINTKYGAKKGNQARTLIRGMNPQRWTTIKGMDEQQITDEDEYYILNNIDVLSEYYFLEITIIL